MMRPYGILLAFAVILGSTALAVRIGDRDLFVSPPEVVAEGFVRQVILERYEQARAYLSDPESTTEADLHALRARLIRRTGPDPSDFQTRVESGDRDHARVTVILTSRDRSDGYSCELKFDSDWKIASNVASNVVR